jgi:hypothetical protein
MDEQEKFNKRSDEGGDSTPKPDPTFRTTEQLIREITRLDEAVKLRSESNRAGLEGQINLTRERFEAMRRSLDERFATQQFAIQIAEDVGRRSKEDTKELFEVKLDAMRELLSERYQTQTKALDAAFVAQQTAVATSFDASEKAMAAALLAAKEAVEKANVATEKRFDNVNEQLAAQTETIGKALPRAEAEARMLDLDRRINDVKSAVDTGFTGVRTRNDIGFESRYEAREDSQGDQGRIAIWISVASVALLFLVTIFNAVVVHIGH